MSLLDSIRSDIDDIFTSDGFWESHSINGVSMHAIVHASTQTTRSAILDLGTFGADTIVCVRVSEYGSTLPTYGSIFYLDSIEYRVASASSLGKYAIKIALNRIEG